MSKQRVTLYIDSHVWKMMRVFSAHEGISASEITEGLMRQVLADTNIPEQFGSWDGWSKSSEKPNITHNIAHNDDQREASEKDEPH